MRMRQLEAFRATILHGTISSAAKSLKTTQPTISRQLTDLEYSLKLKLLIRRKGQVVPTPDGMVFYRRLDDVFDAFAKLRNTAQDISLDRGKTLKILSLPALSINIIPEIIKEFSFRHSDVSITMNTTDIKNYFNMIMDDDLDIAFGNYMGEQPSAEQIILANVNYICALPSNHRLCAKKIINEEDLIGENLISLDGNNIFIFHQHEELYERIKPIKQFNTQHSVNAYPLVHQGLCSGILEPFSAPIWAATGVEIRPFKPEISYKYSAYIKQDRKLSPLIIELLEIAAKKFKEYETK